MCVMPKKQAGENTKKAAGNAKACMHPDIMDISRANGSSRKPR